MYIVYDEYTKNEFLPDLTRSWFLPPCSFPQSGNPTNWNFVHLLRQPVPIDAHQCVYRIKGCIYKEISTYFFMGLPDE